MICIARVTKCSGTCLCSVHAATALTVRCCDVVSNILTYSATCMCDWHVMLQFMLPSMREVRACNRAAGNAAAGRSMKQQESSSSRSRSRRSTTAHRLFQLYPPCCCLVPSSLFSLQAPALPGGAAQASTLTVTHASRPRLQLACPPVAAAGACSARWSCRGLHADYNRRKPT